MHGGRLNTGRMVGRFKRNGGYKRGKKDLCKGVERIKPKGVERLAEREKANKKRAEGTRSKMGVQKGRCAKRKNKLVTH